MVKEYAGTASRAKRIPVRPSSIRARAKAGSVGFTWSVCGDGKEWYSFLSRRTQCFTATS